MSSDSFPEAPARVFFVGLGGIGMSALAQFLVTRGYEVSGSDRDLTTPSQAALFCKLRQQGISVYHQDGSGVAALQPEALIFSSAIEESNPDFLAAKAVPRFHRSVAMAQTINRSGLTQIAVAGSCGKTSVTGWLASALNALGQNPVMINGGYTNEFISDDWPGNFKPGENFIVYEADESDGSLINFKPDIALLLNLGLDHYEKDKLDDFFRTFLSRAQQAVVSDKLVYLVADDSATLTFSEDISPGSTADLAIEAVTHTPTGCAFACQQILFKTTQFGEHSVANALAVIGALTQSGFSLIQVAQALSAFTGVVRRFDYKGMRGNKRIYDDYAHNVQKISACIVTAQQLSQDPVIAVFQPHGYGPLRFMRQALKKELKCILRPGDQFIFVPVFYAGGTATFQPSSMEVAEEFSLQGLNVIYMERRKELKSYLDYLRFPASVVILGARDPSLSAWSQSLTGELK